MLPSSDQLVRYVESNPGEKTRKIAAQLKVSEAEFDDLVEIMLRLQLDGSLLRVPERGWEIPERTDYRVGVLDLARGGQGFVRVAPGSIKEDDVFVRPDDMRGALAGDAVLILLTKAAGRGGSGRGPAVRLREGRVVDVVRRSRRLLRGKFSRGKKGGTVKPADGRVAGEIFVGPDETGDAVDGESVLVRMMDGAAEGMPRGQVVARIKDEGSYETDLLTILEIHELPREYPALAVAEAKAMKSLASGAAWPGRVDLRKELIFTIDPVDAKDFDDAVSLEELPGGEVRLGVHIADVSHFVRPGSLLDAEAEKRGTSVYLPGQVVPMLPERLSNDLASLRPDEDRLTKTVRITFGRGGKVKGYEVFRSVIRSRRRFTYEEALAILENIETGKELRDLPEDHAAFTAVLRSMARLRDELHQVRRERGALYLDIPKLRLVLGPDGSVAALGRDARDPSHALIEEFMLAANEAVASYFDEHKLPLVARVHPPPEERKLEELKNFVKALGFRFDTRGGQEEFQKLIDDVSGDPLSSVIQLGLLRTMGHAEYVLGNGLHFALATTSYCHFTSPIRRYPDLLVHQVLDEHFDNKLRRAARREELEARLPHAAEKASELERRAEEAEREMTSLLLIRHLAPMVGQEMDARIVSVHPFGFFVRVEETLVEGLIHVSGLGDDFYEFNREKLALRGKKKGKQYQVGERVRVELHEVDADMRVIGFRLVKKLEASK